MTSTTSPGPDRVDTPDRLDPALVKLALALMLGALASGLDTTIVNVTFDQLIHRFHASVGTTQWVSTGYLLALTMVMPLTGWAIGRFGARTTWLASLGLFLVGSMLCGIAWSMPALIAFRVVQGLGGGMLLPLIRVILGRAAGQQRMGRAMVFVAVPGSLSPALGPILGGLVTYGLGWRWAFYINAPICLAGLVLAWRLLPRDERGRGAVRLDIRGLALLSGGLVAIVAGLSEAGNRHSFTATEVWLPSALGVALIVGYTVHALATRYEPIINPRLFRARAFTASSILQFLLNATLFGSVFLVPLYYQQVRHASVMQAGLLLAPLGAGTALSIAYVGKLIDRTHAERAITLVAMVLSGVGLVPYALLGNAPDQAVLALALFVAGLGQGAIKLTAFTIGFRGLSPDEIAPASSANRVLQQLGGVLGTVVLALIFQNAATGHALPSAFGHTFAWAIGLTALAVVPALALPPRPQD
ncbi:DHA2 family efflux MFS transporter permease subunit [Catenulispora sp. NF23]|uniref:DHA2 family efflux MFS transporter permease subunit n=1 Tax=Catenulispora pinistramenti TaxID=2705254 RepID=A0ABS5KYL3_9ACTN|nr:DHA2 family efflux MFS transporter permease subunit [Catenulispora pinistramenti]MBS2534725.1 DHA2 family efflux MFS transporter permease subunit [Catenulispora pinistramenti]MBS2551146.1 DHA2 family efflux MFS transporter permease subunit [Catenulispora pinistramenti]